MFARLRFPGAGAAIATIPETAVVRRGPLTGVFVIEGDVARLRWITLGVSRNGHVEAASGLTAGERIIVVPAPELTDGRRIETAR